MSIGRTVVLASPKQAHAAILAVWEWAKPFLADGCRLVLEIRLETRSAAQNRIMWSCLGDLSQHVTWFGKRMTPEGWKDFITGHLDGQDLVPNMDQTGFISIGRGKSTSRMSVKEMTAVIDLCHAFGDQQGVPWRQKSLGREWSQEELAK